ncbi:hypothetical protein [Algicola sagamiensis]|uniref:hypothetical protein n=1 Tax=Algicola sagamiensis TaxID=163869 RepID=UPI00036312C3|nr:hypothetical protein [Algicola sagamiensis]
MLDALIKDLCEKQNWPTDACHPGGLDLQIDSMTLHIRELDGLLSAFIPISLDDIVYIEQTMLDWPSIQLSKVEGNEYILWSREWLDKLDSDSINTMVERLLKEAIYILGSLNKPSSEASTSSATSQDWHKC